MFKAIEKCRVCGSKNLFPIIHLGHHSLTGVFPASPEENPPTSPINLIRCANPDCALVQLEHSVEPDMMFGDTYGYASSANFSMVKHLEGLKEKIQEIVPLKQEDVVLDIGCNDGTFLGFFSNQGFKVRGMDPSAKKYYDKYKSDVQVVFDYFSAYKYKETWAEEKAKLVTSFACIYDIEDLTSFVRDIKSILREDGVWAFEAAYLPAIIKNLAFDGCCAEHILYLGYKTINYIFKQIGLKTIHFSETPTNGGSFFVLATHSDSEFYKECENIKEVLEEEDKLYTDQTYKDLAIRVEKHKEDFINLLTSLKQAGKTICGLGASTKFNVVLQYCGINVNLISYLGEVTEYKVGRFTPGTLIPIVSEEQLLTYKPDYLVIGPYHFKESFLRNPKIVNYIKSGGAVIFPLPEIEIVDTITL